MSRSRELASFGCCVGAGDTYLQVLAPVELSVCLLQLFLRSDVSLSLLQHVWVLTVAVLCSTRVVVLPHVLCMGLGPGIGGLSMDNYI